MGHTDRSDWPGPGNQRRGYQSAEIHTANLSGPRIPVLRFLRTPDIGSCRRTGGAACTEMIGDIAYRRKAGENRHILQGDARAEYI